MAELVTKSDLEVFRREVDSSFASVRKDMDAGLANSRKDLDAGLTSVREEIRSLRKEMMTKFEHTEARMTIRLGGMIVVATSVLAALIKL